MTKREELEKYKANQGNDPQDKEFGLKLREVLKKRGMQQKAAIVELRWAKSTFYGYSNGRKRMRIDRFADMVYKLRLTQSEVAELLSAYWEEDDDG